MPAGNSVRIARRIVHRCIGLGLALSSIGCAHLNPAPVVPPLAAGSLDGRVIALDPGHGGPQTGAVAPANGLRESDLNLAVAMDLRARLEAAGARVVLTRDTDVALDEVAARDLIARPATAAQEQAEVFISIHHNASITRDPLMNDVEVYYKQDDPWASRVFGAHVLEGLAQGMRNDASPKWLRPGNYSVLRHASMPAVLLETAYLTAPHAARQLAQPGWVAAEAASIAQGLKAYFALDPPRGVHVDAETTADGRLAVRGRCTRGGPIDPATLEVSIAGGRWPGLAVADGPTFQWLSDAPLPNGTHAITLAGANARGGPFITTATAEVNRPAAQATVRQIPSAAPPAGPAITCIEVELTDALGMPVADGTPVRLDGVSGSETARAGRARFYVRADALPGVAHVQADAVEARAPLEHGGTPGCSVMLRDAATGKPAGPGALFAGGRAYPVDAAGWAWVPEAAGYVETVVPGYAPGRGRVSAGHSELRLDALHGGALHGFRVVIDPAFGGRTPGPVSPTGVRAADVNLALAKALAQRLEAAGARPVLTRSGDTGPDDIERIRMAAQWDAAVYIVVSAGAPPETARSLDRDGLQTDDPVFAGHYPGSSNGERLAQALAEHSGPVPVRACVAYPVQQTPCPAVWWQPVTVLGNASGPAAHDAAAVARLADGAVRALVDYAAKKDSQ